MIKSMMASVFIFLAVLFSASPSHGIQSNGTNDPNYPAPQDDYVNDFADVLQSTDALRLRNTLRELEEKTGIEGCVVTVKSISDYRTGDSTVDQFATNLFNSWGIGNRNTKNGFLLLVSVSDRKSRIELGTGYGIRYNAQIRQVMDQTIVPLFKIENYSQGIYDGTSRIIDALTTQGAPASEHGSEASRQGSPAFDFKAEFTAYRWYLLGYGVAVVLILAGISCLRRGRSGWGYAFLATAGAIIIGLLAFALSGSGRRSRNGGWGGGGGGWGGGGSGGGGFGGGRSSGGGGASGSW